MLEIRCYGQIWGFSYHDMQYTSTGGGTHGPVVTATQDAELRHQIRRLSHHPAIVIWDGNNENPVNAGAAASMSFGAISPAFLSSTRPPTHTHAATMSHAYWMLL